MPRRPKRSVCLRLENLECKINPGTVSMQSIPSDDTAEEGGGGGYFSVQRSGDTSQSLLVYLDQGGVGSSPYQYVLSTMSDGNVAPGSPITIPAMFSSVTVTMTATDDLTAESTQDVTITIQTNANYTVGTSSTSTLHIIDNDSGGGFPGGGGSPPGGGGGLGPSPGVTPVFVPGLGIEVTPRQYLIAIDDERFVATDTAADFSVMANDIGAIQITGVSTPGKGLATIVGSTVHYVPNPGASGDDNFTYTVSDGAGHYDTATVRLKIAGAASVPEVTVSTPTPNATEPVSPTDFSIGISSFVFHRQGGELTQPLTIRYSISGSASRADIKAAPSPDLYRGEVTFDPDEPTVTIPFLPVYDTLREGVESLSVALLPSSAYRVGDGYFASVDIHDPATGAAGNRVWADSDGNGSQDNEEPGVESVKVTLIKLGSGGEETIDSKNSQPNGSFEFTGLAPGNLYRFKFEVVDPLQLGLYAFSPKWATTADKNSDVDPTTGLTDYFTVQAGEANVDLDAGLVPLSGRTLGEIIGPGAVPGLSTYTYSLRLTGNVSNVSWGLQNLDPQGSTNLFSFGSATSTYDSGSISTLLAVNVKFENTQPAKIRLTASPPGMAAVSKNVNLVQVIVSDPADEASFTPSTSTTYLNAVADTNQGIGSVFAASGSSATGPGLKWAARV